MSAFDIFRDPTGCWHARRRDGLVEGWFADRLGAVRFARRESAHLPLMRR